MKHAILSLAALGLSLLAPTSQALKGNAQEGASAPAV
jgi:hypothetical protein